MAEEIPTRGLTGTASVAASSSEPRSAVGTGAATLTKPAEAAGSSVMAEAAGSSVMAEATGSSVRTKAEPTGPGEPAEEPTSRVAGGTRNGLLGSGLAGSGLAGIGARGRAKVNDLLKAPGRRTTEEVPPSGDRAAGRASAVGTTRVATEAVRAARVAGASRGPRRARLHLKRIDPWSMMKFSCAVSVVLAVVLVVATSVLYLALDAMGVFDSVNQALAEVTGSADNPAEAFRLTSKGIIGTAILLGVVNTVLFTALMTLGAFIYNVCADLVGGIEITLSEKD